jgi:hypothetical protein
MKYLQLVYMNFQFVATDLNSQFPSRILGALTSRHVTGFNELQPCQHQQEFPEGTLQTYAYSHRKYSAGCT